MGIANGRELRPSGKALLWFMLASLVPSPVWSSSAPLRLMLEREPVTLNPRQSGDAIGQRLGALIFRALTRVDEDLNTQPDLASGWEISARGKLWKFKIRPGLKDHGGESITAEKLAQCLENYRNGKPSAIQRASFPGWLDTKFKGDQVLLRLDHPSPYLAKNLTMLRYFRVGGNTVPCAEPKHGEPLVGSGLYRPDQWDPTPDRELILLPVEPQAEGRRPLRIEFVQDDNSRALRLARGEVDLAPHGALTLTKIRWLQREHSNRYDVLERDGVTVGYLAMNLKDPILAQKKVRQAISLAIDRESIVKHKFSGFCSIAGSLLSPMLPESRQISFAYDPARAEALLDEAGFKRPGPGLPRFELRHRTTPVREGIETALMFQEMLGKVGIKVILDSVEPAVFLASIKKGAFQLYASRWVGVSDGSILYRTLRSGQPDNRVSYVNAEMDRLLDQMMSEDDLAKRLPAVRRAQELMAEDLPYFPLWYWNNALIVRKGLKGVTAGEISLSGAYEPLTRFK